MDQVKRKKDLVGKLSDCQKTLNVPRLYMLPRHRESKNWLAKVAAILKNLDETDYQAFMKLKKRLDRLALRTTRKPVAEEIDDFLREKVMAYKFYDFESKKQSRTPRKNPPKLNTPYVEKKIISGFSKKKDKFNYKKLLKLLKELNSNVAKQQQYASAMLIRATLDHIPPLLGFIDFKGVTKSYRWNTTDKKFMKSLLEFKDDASGALHRPISEDEDLFEIHDLPSRNRFNRLLQECLKKGGDTEFIKSKQLKKKISSQIQSKIKISLVENKSGSWQNYSIGNYIGYSFKFVLDIDNFKSSKLDYVSVYLEANSNNGLWTAKYFVFETDKTDLNKPYEIEAGKQKPVTVIISDQELTRHSREHRFKPSVDMNTLTLYATTKSRKSFKYPIKESMLK